MPGGFFYPLACPGVEWSVRLLALEGYLMKPTELRYVETIPGLNASCNIPAVVGRGAFRLAARARESLLELATKNELAISR